MDEMTALALRYRDGDTEAFDALYEYLNPKMLGRAYSRVPIEDVEDVIQNSWEAVVKGLEDFEVRAAFTTWVFRILENKLNDVLRRRYKEAQLATEGPHVVSETELAVLRPSHIAEQYACLVDDIISRLPPQHHELARMVILEDYNLRDVADRFGITYEAARSRWRRICRHVIMNYRELGIDRIRQRWLPIPPGDSSWG